MRTRMMWVVAVVLSFGLLSCGGGDDSSSTVNLPGDENQQLTEATVDQLVQGCESFQSAVTDGLTDDDLCMMAAVMSTLEWSETDLTDENMAADAVTGGEEPMTCEQVYTTCKSTPEYVTSIRDGMNSDMDCTDVEIPENCTATVGELEACLQSMVDLQKQAFSSLSCDDTESYLSLMEEFEDFQTPECDVIMTKCPDMFSDDSSEPTPAI